MEAREPEKSEIQEEAPPKQIVEAQGWIITETGKVILTAQPMYFTAQATWIPKQVCE